MISQDQVMGQLRILIPAIGGLVSLLGWANADHVNAIVAQIMIALGPLSVVAASVWSLFANTRQSIMTSASKPIDANTPAPQIILPKEEADLAQKLPENVQAADLSNQGTQAP